MSYLLEGGDLFIFDADLRHRRQQIGIIGDKLAIAYDAESETVFKHGRHEYVRKWWDDRYVSHRIIGYDIAILEFPANAENIEVLNKIIEGRGALSEHIDDMEKAAITWHGSSYKL